MQRRLVVGAMLLTILLFLGGAYIARSMDRSTERLYDLIGLYQGEHSREGLKDLVSAVVTGIQLRATVQRRPWSEVLAESEQLVDVARSCGECHRKEAGSGGSEVLAAELTHLEGAMSAFDRDLRVFAAMSNDQPGHDEMESNLLRRGAELTEFAVAMYMRARSSLETTQLEMLMATRRSNRALYVLLGMGPLLLVVAAFWYMLGFTRPVRILLESTRKIQQGDWGHRVQGLKYEYSELGQAFNEMTAYLREYLQRVETSESRYRALFEMAGDAIFLIETEGGAAGDILSANPAAAEMHGYSVQELEGMNLIHDLDSQEAAQAAPERMDRLIRGEKLSFEITHRRRDGSLFPVDVTATSLVLEGHTYLLSIVRDISARKAAERELLLFHEAVASALDGIQLVGLDGRVLYSNPAVEEMYGFTPEELLGMSVNEMNVDPQFAERHILPKVMQQGKWSGEVMVKRKNGTSFPIWLCAALVREAEGRPLAMVGVIRDISELKRMEGQLREAKADWEGTFDTISDLITIHDAEFKVLRQNRAALEMWGPNPTPDLPVGREQPPGWPAGYGDREALSAQAAVQEFEYRDEDIDRSFAVRCIPRIEPGGLVSGHIRIMQDITEKKQAEEALRRAEQLRTVGDLAASLAHEIKNPLAGMKASMELLAEEDYLKTEDRELVSSVAEEIMRVEVLMRSLLDYARPPTPRVGLVDVPTVVEWALRSVLPMRAFSDGGPEIVRIRKHYAESLPGVYADEAQLRQVLVNILLNAREAMPEGGVVSIEGVEPPGKGGIVELRISDTGRGFDEAIAQRLFEPFFTTRSKGSGLGLAVTKQLVEQQGGSIRAENIPSGGATFVVTLVAFREVDDGTEARATAV